MKKLFREFVGGPATDDIEHTRYNKLSLAMLKDGLGSTIALTGRDGKAIARIGYDAWGEFRWNGKDNNAPCKDEEFDNYLERLENTWGFGRGNHNGWAFGKHFGSKLTPYLYTGRRYSSLTSQYFNRNRYYSPALGRFTTKDPIGFNGGMNLYGYVSNNPMKWVDPYGLYWISTWLSHVYSKGVVVGGFGVPYPSLTPSGFSMGTSLLWLTVKISDYWSYQKIWVPEPPCYDVFPSVTGIDIKHDVNITDYWPVMTTPPSSFFTTDRAEYIWGHKNYQVP